jgi:hypothetical protein
MSDVRQAKGRGEQNDCSFVFQPKVASFSRATSMQKTRQKMPPFYSSRFMFITGPT